MQPVEEMIEKLKTWGATFVGFSNVGEHLPGQLSPLPYAVTIGVKLSDFILDEIRNTPTYTYFHHYRTVNTLIDQITLRGMMLLEDWGYQAMAIPASQTVKDAPEAHSGVFPHKTAAVMAGLGWIGKNGLLISDRVGPRVRLGTILTQMELPVREFPLKECCGSCRLCVDSCPAMALSGEAWKPGMERARLVDAEACSQYMNKKFKHIGRGSVCGICIQVCPYGKKQQGRTASV